MTVLLGAAVLVWLAGAVLTGLADTTTDPAGSPAVVPVASVDGSPDDQSAGGAPKSPGASQPRAGGDSGGSAEAGHPASSASKPDSGSHPEPQSAPADKATAPRPEAKPASDTPGTDSPGTDTAPPAHPAAEKTPGDPGTDGAVARTAPAHTKPDPSTPEAAPPRAPGAPPRSDSTSANQGAPGPRPPGEHQPAPGSTCEQGGDCAPTPAPPPPGAPPPSGPSNAGSGGGAGGPGGPHHQPGTDDGSWFSSFQANQRPTTPPQPGATGSDSYDPNAGRGPPHGAPQPMMIPHVEPSSPLITLPRAPGAAPQDDTSRGGSPTPARATPTPAAAELPGPLGADAHPRDPRQAGQEFYQGVLASQGKAADRLRGLSPEQVDELATQGPPRTAEDVLNLATGTHPAAPGTLDELHRQQAIQAWFADSRDHPADFDRFAAALPYTERVKLEQAFEANKPGDISKPGGLSYWGRQAGNAVTAFNGWAAQHVDPRYEPGSWPDRWQNSFRNIINNAPANLATTADHFLTEDEARSGNPNFQPLPGETPEQADQRLHPLTQDFQDMARGYGDELGPIVTHGDAGKLGSDFYNDPAGTLLRYAPAGKPLTAAGRRLVRTAPAEAARDAVRPRTAPQTRAEPTPPSPGPRVLPRSGAARPTPHTLDGPAGPKPTGPIGKRATGQAGKAPTGVAGTAPRGRPTARATGRTDDTPNAMAGARPHREPLTSSANSNRRGPGTNNTPTPTTGGGRHPQPRDTAGGTPPPKTPKKAAAGGAEDAGTAANAGKGGRGPRPEQRSPEGSQLLKSGTINPASVRFTQDDIGGNFRDGRTVKDLVEGLRNGSVDPAKIPMIRLVEKDGKLYSLDNRRLAAFKEAGVDVRYRMAKPREIASEWERKFTTDNDGTSIIIRGGRW
uniref:hypothetical protein n=1 Tax=Pseudonocardia sp. CA-138482 TaxID=3240023 RepID=UPI003F49333C